MTFLTVQGLGKRYGGVLALEEVSISVARGSRTAIVGPSGSGKTTLLRLLAGFEAPDAGRIVLEGQVVAEGRKIVPAHRRNIGFVAQEGALFPHLSIAENIGFGLDRGEPKRDQHILQLMQAVELDADMAARRPHELSGGQQQRVALARSLARRPRLMLLDEPFSALDTGLRESMRRAVGRILQAAGITAVLVTHDQAEALSFADQVAVLRDGRLVQVGTPQAVYSRPADRATATFLGDALILSAQLDDGFARCRLGRIAIASTPRRGAAEIMLRPEQLCITTATSGLPPEPPGCLGVVTDVEFAGPMCTIAVALDPTADQPKDAPLTIKTTSFDLPGVGARVRISVRGEAHVFAPAKTLDA